MSEVIKGAEIAGELSFDDIRGMLQRALFGDGYGSGNAWITDISASHCIVARGGPDRKSTHQRYPYTIEGDSVKLGEPVDVKLSWDDKPATVQAGEGEREPSFLATDIRGLTFSDANDRIETTIEVCRDSTRKHKKYGIVKIDQELRESMVRNFNDRVREVDELPIDYDHKDGPAGGWIYGLRNEGSSLFADVWLPQSAAERIRAGEYRFFSPEYDPKYVDPKTGTQHGATLLGGGWTNRPEFRELPAVTCSETDNGASPQEDIMPDANPAPQNDGAQQFSERIRQLEDRNRALELAEQRRQIGQTFSELRFSDGREALAPASRTALLEAVLPLEEAQRNAVVEAVKNLQFVEFGERGFTHAEKNPNEVNDAEVKELMAMTPLGQAALR